MGYVSIRKLRDGEEKPMELLLLADPSVERIDAYIHRGDCYLAEMAKQAVGVCVLVETAPDTVELMNVAVAESSQGQGIGKQLVNHAVDVARTNGYLTIEVGTGNAGIGQLALYQKCGFRIMSIDFDHFSRNYPEPIVENGILCRDMIRLVQVL